MPHPERLLKRRWTGFGLTTQAGGEIDRAPDGGVIQALSGTDIADDGTAGVNANTEAANIFQPRRLFEASGLEDIPCVLNDSSIEHARRGEEGL